MLSGDADRDLSAAATPPSVVVASVQRTRFLGILLIGACVSAFSGAVLPWFTPVTVYLSTGASKRDPSAHMWDSGICILMPLLLAPLIALARAGVNALRGRAQGRLRRQSTLASLLGVADVLFCAGILLFAVGMSDWNPYWGRGTETDILLAPGAPVSLVSYFVGLVASLFLPAGDGKRKQLRRER